MPSKRFGFTNNKTVAHLASCLAFWYTRSKRLEAALDQAYRDGGCRKDEAKEMVEAVIGPCRGLVRNDDE